MASNAQKVFAKPELLEHILLKIDADSGTSKASCFIKELFVFQRVNRTFATTIRSSNRIHVKMGLRGRSPKAQSLEISEHGALACFQQGDFTIPPFKYCEESRLSYHRGPARTPGLWLNFIVSADNFAAEYQGTLGLRAGLQGTSGRTYGEDFHTWRKMKLTTTRMPLIVNISVVRPQHYQSNPFLGPSYTDWVRFRPGDGTLGDLADVFEQIGRRGWFSHDISAPQFRGAYWMDVSRKGRMRLNWKHGVIALVAVCHAWLLRSINKLLWGCLGEEVVVWLWVVSVPLVLYVAHVWLKSLEGQGDRGNDEEVLIFN